MHSCQNVRSDCFKAFIYNSAFVWGSLAERILWCFLTISVIMYILVLKCSLLSPRETLRWRFILIEIPFFFFFFFFFFWRGVGVCRLGGKKKLHRPTCLPPRHSNAIRATSATYNHSSHGNTRSLTHWTRPGIKPTTAWLLVGFISTVSQ